MKRAAFTLAEMVVATGLVLALTGVVGGALWSVWRGFITGVATAQATQSAADAAEMIAHDLFSAPLRRVDDVAGQAGRYTFPVTQRRPTSRVVGRVSWSLTPAGTLTRDGTPALRGNHYTSFAILALSAAGPMAVEVEAEDPARRARVKLRKLVDVPLLRQRARFASGWEQRS